MIRQVDLRQWLTPLLQEDVLQALATMLSSMTAEHHRQKAVELLGFEPTPMSETDFSFGKRWHEAVRLLKRTRHQPGSFPSRVVFDKSFDDAATELEAALDKVSRLLGSLYPPRHLPPQMKDWVFHAMPIVFTMSEMVKSCGRRGGVGRNSLAAKFSALAITRIGWRDEHGRPIKPASIARYCEAPAVSGNDHDLS